MKNLPDSERDAAGKPAGGREGGEARRPYARPQLIDYGPVAKLTRGTRSGAGEITPLIEKRKCL